jgi:hypothetical protein
MANGDYINVRSFNAYTLQLVGLLCAVLFTLSFFSIEDRRQKYLDKLKTTPPPPNELTHLFGKTSSPPLAIVLRVSSFFIFNEKINHNSIKYDKIFFHSVTNRNKLPCSLVQVIV